MRWILAFMLLAHGVAHLPGFFVGWQLVSFPKLPYRTTIFGTIDIGDVGTRLVGIGWLMSSIVFASLAAAIALRIALPSALLPLALGASAVLCVSAWPKASYGFITNAAIAAMLVASERYGLI
ncbi:MAG TPA: hypothetical protein VH436_07820 [Vicinamibacterales bacterium]|jgi:hypothetical protein